MAFTEETTYKVEVNDDHSIGVRQSDVVLKDGVEVGRTYTRACFSPGDDVSDQVKEVRDIAAVVWTPEVIATHQATLEGKLTK